MTPSAYAPESAERLRCRAFARKPVNFVLERGFRLGRNPANVRPKWSVQSQGSSPKLAVFAPFERGSAPDTTPENKLPCMQPGSPPS
jgi:hypothetical protein